MNAMRLVGSVLGRSELCPARRISSQHVIGYRGSQHALGGPWLAAWIGLQHGLAGMLIGSHT